MQRFLPFIVLLLLWLVFSCNEQGPALSPAENALDAGREFVRAALDGDYVKASRYLLEDSLNKKLFDQQIQNYNSMDGAQKRSYLESSIRPVAILSENDSTTLFRYYHSANPKDTTTLRIIKKEGKWLIDLKSVLKL
jgi:hypothetical protein